MSVIGTIAASMLGAAAGVWVGFNLSIAAWMRRFREIIRDEIDEHDVLRSGFETKDERDKYRLAIAEVRKRREMIRGA